jgi:hypothetical protein
VRSSQDPRSGWPTLVAALEALRPDHWVTALSGSGWWPVLRPLPLIEELRLFIYSDASGDRVGRQAVEKTLHGTHNPDGLTYHA